MNAFKFSIEIMLLFILLFVTSCGDEGIPDGYYDPHICDTEIVPIYQFNEATVTYKVSASGDYQLASIIWKDDEGEHTETEFTLPFEKEVDFTNSADFRLAIEGNVTNGIINLEITVVKDNKVVATQTSNCSKTIN